MHLLVIARDYKNFVSRQVTYNLLTSLSELTRLSVWHERGSHIQSILEQQESIPDFILILEYWETNATKVTGLRELSVPYAVSLQDLHWDVMLRKELIEREQIPYIFTASKAAFAKFFPEFLDRMLWLPHHVNTQIFKDYQTGKEIDYLLMGLASKVYYPFRAQVLHEMKDIPGFVFHKHPGYREIRDDEDQFVREKYAREINRSKIFFTCGGKEQYPVAKYFEVLACNTLLLAPHFPELDELGFVPGVHFVAVDESDFKDKAEYYLHHEKERLQIAQQGYAMVQARHSSRQRARELVAVIEDMIKSANRPPGHRELKE